MGQHCEHNSQETTKGQACDIRAEVKRRNGLPLWWCKVHGREAWHTDGSKLDRCVGSWDEPPPDDRRCIAVAADGEFAVRGALAPALEIGAVPHTDGGVELRRRNGPTSTTAGCEMYDIVEVRVGSRSEIVESMAARAYGIAELMGTKVERIACRRCESLHIDELMFATRNHSWHLCNFCGRGFNRPSMSVANPLADTQSRLGLPDRPPNIRSERPLTIETLEYAGIAISPSLSAIVSTISFPERAGFHVRAWAASGELAVDDTFSSVTLDGQAIKERHVRMLAVQRHIAENTPAPIVSLACARCGHSILSPIEGDIKPVTRHTCDACGAANPTRHRTFLNPLADKLH